MHIDFALSFDCKQKDQAGKKKDLFPFSLDNTKKDNIFFNIDCKIDKENSKYISIYQLNSQENSFSFDFLGSLMSSKVEFSQNSNVSVGKLPKSRRKRKKS